MTLVMFPLKKKFKYADYASSATFTKSAKIMLGFPNYAKKIMLAQSISAYFQEGGGWQYS